MLRMLAFRPDANEGTLGSAGGRTQGRSAPLQEGRSEHPARGASPAKEKPSSAASEKAVSDRPEPDAAAAGDTGFSDWHAFVARLGLKGMAAQLADNCVFEDWNGKQLALR